MKTSDTVLVTGASGGIGLELAGIFARNGFTPVLVSRDAAKLTEAAGLISRESGAAPVVIPCDLSIPGAAAALVRTLEARSISVDILVNNAGFGMSGSFTVGDPAEQTGMINLNITALTELTRLLLPGMISRGRGRVLNVASTAGFQPGPFMAVYYATKSYVLSFTQALGNELRGTGVTATVLCPGPTRTAFLARAGISGTQLLRRLAVLDAVPVAEAGFRGCMTGAPVVITGLLNRCIIFTERFLPRRMVIAIVRSLHSGRAGH